MRSLRYQTWRRVFALGVVAVWLPFLVPVSFGSGGLAMIVTVLGWVVAGLCVVFLTGAQALRRFGLLEFTYTEKDYNSYLYNADKLYQQMKDSRRSKKS